MILTPIERITERAVLALEHQYGSLTAPVIISGAAADWPAMRKLQLSEIKTTLGAIKVPVRSTDDEFQVFFGSKAQDFERRRMLTLAEYVDAIEKSGSHTGCLPYAGNIAFLTDPAVAPKLGSLREDCRFPHLELENRTLEYRLWIGGRGQRSTIHNDSYHNFNAQIVGRKHFIAFAPDQHSALHAIFFHRGMWVSPVDPNNPDFALYPRFRDARGVQGELSPGDILYLPRFWWHAAQAITTSVNINQWVYSGGPLQWWHEQPQARRFISFKEILEQQRHKFDALSKELQPFYKDDLTKLTAELTRLDEQR